MYADCGKCPACQQARADRRTSRINNAKYDGYVRLFVTLTYRNINIPYIRKNEITENSEKINIYRDCSVRRVRSSSDYKVGYKYTRKTEVIGTVDCYKYHIFLNPDDVRKLRKIRGQSDSNKVSVPYFKDVQNFEKRLRINLKRWYGITQPIYSFKCCELGPTTQRAHFHLLLDVPKDYLAQCQRSIIASWPYDSRISQSKSIQIARNASSYVSSYVNRGADFPKLFDSRRLRPKHSYSKGYGLQNSAFSLESLLSSLGRGSLTYVPTTTAANAVVRSVLFPKYVCNRYFSKVYGYSRLSYDEIVALCKNPEQFFQFSDVPLRMYRTTSSVGFPRCLAVNSLTEDYDYDFEKINKTIRDICRLRSRFCRDFVYFENGIRYVGIPENEYSYELFADYYYRFWRCYASTCLKLQYEDITDVRQLPFVFDNLRDVYNLRLRSDVLQYVDYTKKDFYINPNLFPKNVSDTLSMTEKYYSKYKRRKVTNRVMVYNNFNV